MVKIFNAVIGKKNETWLGNYILDATLCFFVTFFGNGKSNDKIKNYLSLPYIAKLVKLP